MEYLSRVGRGMYALLLSKVCAALSSFMVLGLRARADDDYHLPALTVRETLRFAAIISLPSSVSRKRKIARAEEVLKMLGLRDCADGMVGGELLKGISGGEKRRLSLACQMANFPATCRIKHALMTPI